MPAAHDQLTDLVAAQAVAFLVLQPDLSPRDRDPHRTRPDIQLVWRQVQGALRLGKPVHRVELRPGELLLDLHDMAGRQGGGGVGQVAQAAQVVCAQVHAQQHGEDGRHAGETGHLLFGHLAQDRRREGEAALQHQRAAEPEGHQQLV